MKSIKLSDLAPGIVSEVDYCTERGDILIHKDVIITQNHIDVLKRRNIFEIYKKGSSEDEELQRLLSADFDLGELDLDEESKPALRPIREPVPELLGPAKALELPVFKNIKTGVEGLEQLNKSKRAAELDRKYKSGRTSDRPAGPALREDAKDVTPKDRSDAYKNRMITSYDEALNQVKLILNALANGDKLQGSYIRNTVEALVKRYINDRNILLNLSTTKCKDTIYIYSHSLNVCLLSINIAAAFGYSREQVIEIGMGALLFDVGMLLIPRDIYLKKGRLSKDQRYEIQKHPVMGLHLLEVITRLPESIPYIAYQSHERENGTGYPKKRTDRLIHSFSKIIQVADIYVALASSRPYRDEYMPYKAMEAIIKMTKQGLISGEFVKAFLNYTSLFPVGSLVELNNKRIAKVIQSNGTSFAKPVVSVLTTDRGELLPERNIYQLDLADDTDTHIVKALQFDHIPDVSLMDGF